MDNKVYQEIFLEFGDSIDQINQSLADFKTKNTSSAQEVFSQIKALIKNAKMSIDI